MDSHDVRAMVTAFAAGVARKCVEQVDASELTSGYMDDKTNVGGIDWEVTAVYWKDSATCRVQGSPVRDEDHGAHPFMEAFMGGAGDADQGQFSFLLPVAWLPASIPTMSDIPTREEVR